MIIVAGTLHVDEADRDRYLDSCRDVTVAARATAGCLDFHLSADPIEPGRINVFELWESTAAVEAFRRAGPDPEQAAVIRAASVSQYEIASSTTL